MAAPIIRRALLYVPGSSRKMLDKSRSIASVDTVAYDLEDSVPASLKAEARGNLRQLLDQPRSPGIREQAVRINSVGSGHALDDLTEVLKASNLDALVVPKVNAASDLHFVTDVIRHALPQRHPSSPQQALPSTPPPAPLRLIALVESARAVMDLPAICRSSPYLTSLIFAAEDFALDLSLTRTPSLREFLYARSAIVTATRAYGLASAIDLVCTAFRGEDGRRALEDECMDGKRLGFNGKQLIHPSQIEVAQRAFAPGHDELEWAARVVVADEKANRAGKGAWTLDGKMVDVPVVAKARVVLEHAELCGMHVESLRERWKTQEPE